MKPIKYPQNLPISAKREEVIRLIRENQVIVLSGETGSGKTTQIPKFCLEAGLGAKGKQIACTQPRRLAAVSVAARIAEELGTDLGEEVGYKIRFEEKTSSRTRVKLMTDGVLLAETQGDRLLSRYDAIIVDEAHERSLNIDFLLGILRMLIEKRPDLKIIITSATIDTQKFSQAFGNAPIVEVSGRTYPVELRYRPPEEEEGEKSLAEAGVDALEEILLETGSGDVLIFMPTEQDIVECCDLISTRYQRWSLTVLPLYARLTSQEQHRIFEESSRRKVVVSTNVAETSLTIPGIVYVIDTGVARVARYTPSTGTFGLPIESISRSSADQRKGRCGRIQEGICIRLYSEEDYYGRSLYTPPEVLRTNLAEVILRMLSLKIYDIDNFPFVDPPQSAGIRDGFKTLEELRAIKDVNNRNHSKDKSEPKRIKILTREGQSIARLPMDPRLGKMILQAGREGCANEALILAGALSIHDPRDRPSDKAGAADQKHSAFRHGESDFLTFLNIWKGWREIGDGKLKLGALKKYCKENFLSFKRMREWRDLYMQFKSIVEEEKTVSENSLTPFKGNEEALYNAVHKSVLSGFLSHISHRKEKNFYEATKRREAMIFPGSELFNKGGEWLVSAEMVRTSRLYMRVNANIQPQWISQIGSHLVKKSYISPWWEDRTGEILCKEEEKIFGFLLSRDKTVPYGQYCPKEAAEMFIREGLCGENTLSGREPEFLKANRKLWEELSLKEDKLRRRDLLQDISVIEGFYQNTIQQLSKGMAKPQDIFDVRQLNKLIKELGDKELYLNEDDLLVKDFEFSRESYPDYFYQDDIKLSLEYQFKPGEEDDGVTLKIPNYRLSQLDINAIDTMVPGKNRELVISLLKGLPKELRKKLIPLNQHVDQIMDQMYSGSTLPVVEQITPIIYRNWQIVIHPSDWDLDKIPEHLKIRFAIEDKKGKIIKAGRDKKILLEKMKSTPLPEPDFKKIRGEWEKENLSGWKDLDLPEKLMVKNRGQSVPLYPALKKTETRVDLRLMVNRDEAVRAHREGTAALFRAHYRKEEKSLRSYLTLKERMPREILYLGNSDKLLDAFWDRVFLDLFGTADCRREQDFLKLREQQAPRLYEEAEKYGDQLIRMLEVYAECIQAFKRVRLQAKKGREQFLDDRESDLNAILPEYFPLAYEQAHWNDLIRYIRTLTIRTEKGLQDPVTDSKREEEWQVYHGKYQNLKEGISPYSTEKKLQALDELYWMIQEYKVTLFSGGIVKTGMKVSPKRLDDKINLIMTMV